MDTSKEYIEMCEKAIEIQDNWLPKKGDYNLHVSLTGDCSLGIVADESGAHKFQFFLTWLPRQDQLQEIYLNNRKHKINCGQMSMFFEDWRGNELMKYGKDLIAWSMEQLWLAFLYDQKYNKQWDGNNWILK